MAMVAAPVAEEGEGNGRRSEAVEVVLHRALMVRTEGEEGGERAANGRRRVAWGRRL